MPVEGGCPRVEQPIMVAVGIDHNHESIGTARVGERRVRATLPL